MFLIKDSVLFCFMSLGLLSAVASLSRDWVSCISNAHINMVGPCVGSWHQIIVAIHSWPGIIKVTKPDCLSCVILVFVFSVLCVFRLGHFNCVWFLSVLLYYVIGTDIVITLSQCVCVCICVCGCVC